MPSNVMTHQIIGSAIEVHRHLGPGLLEKVYESCLFHELKLRGLSVERQKPLPVTYKGIRLSAGYQLDLVVENQVVVELKTVESLLPIHEAQILSYLKLGRYPLGLLLNFKVERLHQGIRRFIMDGTQ